MDLNENVIKVHIAVFFKSIPDTFKLAVALKDTFSTMFPSGPQMIPLPTEAPIDAPRCIFQNEDGSANLTFGLVRMDLDNSLIAGSPWKSHIEVIELAFINICKSCNIEINRLGIVIQSLIDEELIMETNNKVSIDNFFHSDEKSVAWVTHENISESLKFNMNTSIQINLNNANAKGVLTLDANTSIDSILPKTDIKMIEVISLLLNRIEVKLKNVF